MNKLRCYYAIIQKDESTNNVCIGIINTFGQIEREDYIPIDVYDESLIGMVWTGSEWIKNPNPPEMEE